jgi:transient receptor potential cation channel subfamily V member 5
MNRNQSVRLVMGNTYAMVNERKNEWIRQWAKIMLIVEQSVSREERLAQQSNYSKKMPDGTKILVTRLIQTVCSPYRS